MRVLFLIGLVFLLVAFVAAAAEAFGRTVPMRHEFFMSAYRLWHTLSPGTLIVFEIRMEAWAPTVWELLIKPVLSWLPAWMIFGLPGGLLAWFAHPHQIITPEQKEDLRRQEESLFLYDKLAAEAEKQLRSDGEDPNIDDAAPDHHVHDLFAAHPDREPFDTPEFDDHAFLFDGDGGVADVGVIDDLPPPASRPLAGPRPALPAAASGDEHEDATVPASGTKTDAREDGPTQGDAAKTNLGTA